MNEDKRSPARNIIDLFRNYYRLDIHQFIGNSAHAIVTGLLYKFNERGFPDELKISTKEMFSLSAISDIRTLRNARNLLTSYRHEENNAKSWIIQYQENDIKEYGTYKINYVYLLEYYCNFTEKLHSNYNNDVKLQESYSKKNGLSSKIAPDLLPKSAKNALLSNTILDHTIKDSLSVSNIYSKEDQDSDYEIKKESESDGEPSEEEKQEYYNEGKSLIESVYPMYFVNQQGGLLNEAKRDLIIGIGVASLLFPEKSKQCIQDVAKYLKQPEYLLEWTLDRIHGRGPKNGNK